MTHAHANVRATLEARLTELREASVHSKEDRAPVELDQTSVGRLSRIDSMQGQAMAQAAEKRRLDEIRRVEATLRRLDAGEYGDCLQCGEAIAPARLELDPTTVTCIKCAH